jgi:hypothetical protein
MRAVLEHGFARPARAAVDARGAYTAHVQLKRQLTPAAGDIENATAQVQLLQGVLLQDPLARE